MGQVNKAATIRNIDIDVKKGMTRISQSRSLGSEFESSVSSDHDINLMRIAAQKTRRWSLNVYSRMR
jgi:hypothetical protein